MKESKVANGRVGVYAPSHPKANNRGYIPKARYVMEKHLGRRLKTCEHVHHKDRDKLNDELDNLKLVSIEEHSRLHGKEKRKHDYDAIRDLRSEGLGYKKIAKRLGIPRDSVRSACKSMGIHGHIS